MPQRTPSDLYSLETLVASAARTVAGSSGTWEGFGRVSTLRIQLNVTAASGTTPSLTVTVEDSLDGTNWNALDTFPAKTAVSREVRNITTPFADMLRISWTISGTTPSLTFDVVTFAQAPGS